MLYLGIDLGGTTIKAGIVDEKGKILHKASCVTGLDRGCEAVFQDVAALAFRTLRDGACTMEEIASVGVGFPGIWDAEHSCVPYCSNLKWPDRFPLTEYLGKLLGKTVYAGNDASATALIREGRRLCEDKPDCALMRSVDGDLEQIEARSVIDLAKVGDPDCLELFEQYTERISEGLVSLINLYDPEVIVIGGGRIACGGVFTGASPPKDSG